MAVPAMGNRASESCFAAVRMGETPMPRLAVMRVTQYDNLEPFRQRAMPLLLQRECENCVTIGIIERLAEGRPATRSGVPSVPVLLTVEGEGGEVCAVALQTPPHALLFSPIDDVCAGAIASHLRARNWDGTQFSGILPSVRRLAEQWRARCGRDFEQHLSLQLYRTNRVIDPRPTSGELRAATASDTPLLSEWIDAFGQEIREPFPDPLRAAQIAIEEGRLFVWMDAGEPRAVCAWQGPTPSSVRIGLVYTPPQYRGRGYASNGVAELTRRLLASGRSFCTLFTDKSNPTSNSIYRRIGYEPVADFEHVKFSIPAR